MTDQQKIDCYKIAIETIKKDVTTCMCPALYDACVKVIKEEASRSYEIPETVNIHFPELLYHKPTVNYRGNRWFDNNEEGQNIRLNILRTELSKLEAGLHGSLEQAKEAYEPNFYINKMFNQFQYPFEFIPGYDRPFVRDNYTIQINLPRTNNSWFQEAFDYATKFVKSHPNCYITFKNSQTMIIDCELHIQELEKTAEQPIEDFKFKPGTAVKINILPHQFCKEILAKDALKDFETDFEFAEKISDLLSKTYNVIPITDEYSPEREIIGYEGKPYYRIFINTENGSNIVVPESILSEVVSETIH